MNIGQLDGQPLALQIFNGMTAESTCVNERWAKDQLFRCVCFAGGRHQTILDETVGPIFQSTSSVWRTTWTPCPGRSTIPNFNPRPPCGGRPIELFAAEESKKISIHVLRAEDDCRPNCRPSRKKHFNPRPPCGGRRYCLSIKRAPGNFNPRPPCGGRLAVKHPRVEDVLFQSTSSVWRTTFNAPTVAKGPSISIHVLRVEDDSARSPKPMMRAISIHVLRVEDDQAKPKTGGAKTYFNPRPPCGGRRGQAERSTDDKNFNPRPPCGGRQDGNGCK